MMETVGGRRKKKRKSDLDNRASTAIKLRSYYG